MMPAVPARVDLVTSADRPARGRVRAAALGVIGALLVPLPAAAAPAPCEQALRYAAQSGTGLLRIGHLDLGPAGRTDQPIKNVGVGDAKSALVAQAPVNAAALGRVLNGGPADRKALTEVVQQTAPPNQQEPVQRKHAATEAGPFRLGPSKLTVNAHWEPGMACGNATGEATRAEVEMRRTGVLDGGEAALVRVPQKISGLSTTAMERRGAAARAAASASMTGGRIDVLGGAVRVRIVKPPSLLATMSGTDGGEVRYKPAVLEVSGEGFETARLDTAGDTVELRLDEDADQDGNGEAGDRKAANDPARTTQNGATGSGPTDSGTKDADVGEKTASGADRQSDPAGRDAAENGASEAGAEDTKDGDRLFAGLPKVGMLGSATSLPLPPVPAVPPINNPSTEAAPASGPGTTVRVSLGDVRQAVSGHAIAAKATAIRIAITKGQNNQGYAGSGVILDLDLGLLEVAAVAPEPAAGTAEAPPGGVAGGLPITGPRVDLLALTGVALLIAGAAALAFGLRGRPRP
jgi:hypothetical protein